MEMDVKLASSEHSGKIQMLLLISQQTCVFVYLKVMNINTCPITTNYFIHDMSALFFLYQAQNPFL